MHPNFPNPPLAVTGGQDDVAFVFCPLPPSQEGAWTRETYAPVRLTGHTDSVVCASFSSDGDFVATGGLDGRVRVWRRVKSRRGTTYEDSDPEAWRFWEFITSLEAGGDVHWLQWHPKGPVLAAGCEDASVWLWNREYQPKQTAMGNSTVET